jgi:hypothetical protein
MAAMTVTNTEHPAHVAGKRSREAAIAHDKEAIDVVGLYHNPPEKAVVLCVDEKSGMQALDRSQPVPR